MTLDGLICKAECQDLIAEYFIRLDRGDRSKLVDLFTKDGEVWGRGKKVAEGAALPGLFSNLPSGFAPVHLADNIKITPTGPDTAEGLAYVTAYNMFGKADDPLPRPMPAHPNRIGIINFTFRKDPEGWRISHFKGNVPFIDDGKT